MLWCNLFSSPGPWVLWLRMIRCVLQRSSEVENECNVDLFWPHTQIKKNTFLGPPETRKFKDVYITRPLQQVVLKLIMNKRYIKYFCCIESSQLPSLSSSVLVSFFLGQTLVRILLMNLDAITTLLRRDNTRDLLFA